MKLKLAFAKFSKGYKRLMFGIFMDEETKNLYKVELKWAPLTTTRNIPEDQRPYSLLSLDNGGLPLINEEFLENSIHQLKKESFSYLDKDYIDKLPGCQLAEIDCNPQFPRGKVRWVSGGTMIRQEFLTGMDSAMGVCSEVFNKFNDARPGGFSWN
jgi:hypothetical protein